MTETTFLVLLSVYKPNHGYGIMQFIEKETNGRVTLGAGTLYGAINALLKKNFIAPTGNESNSSKKEYIITELGKQAAERELDRIRKLVIFASDIIRKEG